VAPSIAIAPALQVAVRNAAGTTLANANARVTLTLGTNPGGATLSGTLSAIASNGVATFPDVRISAPGAGYTLVASAAGLPNAISPAFVVAAPNAAPVITTPAMATASTAILP
jgi:hypothetical protein